MLTPLASFELPHNSALGNHLQNCENKISRLLLPRGKACLPAAYLHYHALDPMVWDDSSNVRSPSLCVTMQARFLFLFVRSVCCCQYQTLSPALCLRPAWAFSSSAPSAEVNTGVLTAPHGTPLRMGVTDAGSRNTAAERKQPKSSSSRCLQEEQARNKYSW